MKQYIVDAFTDTPFKGNPAAVCILDMWPEDTWMLNMAFENNLSETAFLVRQDKSWRLRYFTPATEVDLCGHATLASAFVLMNIFPEKEDSVEFITNKDSLKVKRAGDLYAMDFPIVSQRPVPISFAMKDAFGIMPVKAFLGDDLVCVFENEEQVYNLNPNQKLLAELAGRGQHATAQGEKCDCISRSFFPKLGISEDPVCGSAHCQIAPYWAHILEKDEIIAYQASKRGGYLYCKTQEANRVEIKGNACLVAISELQPLALFPYKP